MSRLVFLHGVLLPLALCITGSAFGSSAVDIPVGEFPIGVALNPNTNRIYAVNSGYASNSVSVIDGNTNTVIATVPVGNTPFALDVNPRTNLVYVGNNQDTTVSVIDGRTNAVVATIEGLASPEAVAVNPQTNKIWVVNYYSSEISEIDGRTNEVIANLQIEGQTAQGIAINTALNLVYVASGSTIFVIDGNTDTIITSFNTASLGIGQSIAYDAVSNRLLAVGIAESGSQVVYVLDATTGTELGTITGGSTPLETPLCVVVLVPGSSVLISDNSRSAIIEASENTFLTLRAFHATETPEEIAVNRHTGKFYVAEYQSWAVTAYTL